MTSTAQSQPFPRLAVILFRPCIDIGCGSCVDGSGLARTFFTFAALVGAAMFLPLGAVHMTAGHNALRGSGPNQTDAFNNALTQVGCPDRRIDRLCNTCCPPSPTFTSRPVARRDFVYRASATGSLYRSPLAIMAQTIRAILLASAIAATLVGRLASKA